MKRKRALQIAALLLLSTSAAAAKKPKQVTGPTQPDIFSHECITVNHIYSHKGGISALMRAPGIEGQVHSECAGPATVMLTIGYYDARGNQFYTGGEVGTIAPGTTWQFRHTPILEQHQRLLRMARIINVAVRAL